MRGTAWRHAVPRPYVEVRRIVILSILRYSEGPLVQSTTTTGRDCLAAVKEWLHERSQSRSFTTYVRRQTCRHCTRDERSFGVPQDDSPSMTNPSRSIPS